MAKSILRAPKVIDFESDILKTCSLETESVLDSGICGDIIVVTHQGKPNWKLAIKTFSLTEEKRARSERSFDREARFMQSLDHKYIAKCFTAARCPEYLAITMKYYQRRSLNFHVGSFSLEEAEVAIIQVGCALRYLHARNLVHLDVKLDNVFVDEACNAILADFGLAMEVDPEKRSLQKKQIGGSPGYIAPECVRAAADAELDPYKLDAFNLGVVFWALIFERAPGPNLNYYYETRKKRDLKENVRDLLLRLLRRDPAKRASVADYLRRARRDCVYRYFIDRH
ncbi:hypothetical protein BsWGS_24537 [Bradybaena similaris]